MSHKKTLMQNAKCSFVLLFFQNRTLMNFQCVNATQHHKWNLLDLGLTQNSVFCGRFGVKTFLTTIKHFLNRLKVAKSLWDLEKVENQNWQISSSLNSIIWNPPQFDSLFLNCWLRKAAALLRINSKIYFKKIIFICNAKCK